MRLPLPQSAPRLAEFAAERASRRELALTYLALGPEEQAGAGTRAAVAACLLLERDGSKPLLEPVAPSQLVRILAESAAAPWLSASDVLDAAVSHADLPCFRLRYAEAAAAVWLVMGRFGAPAEPRQR